MIDAHLVLTRLQLDEGIRLKPYTDTVGKLTIGIGRNLTDKGVSLTEATQMCLNDIDACVDYADKTYTWFGGLDPARQLVVVCMIFNLGPNGFAGFKDTITALSIHDYNLAAADMVMSQWAKQVGNRALVYARIMRSGVIE